MAVMKTMVCEKCGGKLERGNDTIWKCRFCGVSYYDADFENMDEASLLGKHMMERIIDSVQQYVKDGPISKQSVIESIADDYELEEDDVRSVVEKTDIDWMDQAYQYAKSVIEDRAEPRSFIEECMESEMYSDEEIEFACDKVADFMEMAVRKVKEMIGNSEDIYTREEIIEYLLDDDYTEEEANYAADHSGISYTEMALRHAKKEIQEGWIHSRPEMMDELTGRGFTEIEAREVIERGRIDFMREAFIIAKELKQELDYEIEDIIEQLEEDEFTKDEIQFAIKQI